MYGMQLQLAAAANIKETNKVEQEPVEMKISEMLTLLVTWNHSFDEIRRMTLSEFISSVEKISGKKIVTESSNGKTPDSESGNESSSLSSVAS